MWKPVLKILPLVPTLYQAERNCRLLRLFLAFFLQQDITIYPEHRQQNAAGDPMEKFCWFFSSHFWEMDLWKQVRQSLGLYGLLWVWTLIFFLSRGNTVLQNDYNYIINCLLNYSFVILLCPQVSLFPKQRVVAHHTLSLPSWKVCSWQ